MCSNDFRPGLPHATFKFLLALAVSILPSAVAISQAQTLTVLYSFKGSPDGSTPTGLVRDRAGNLYGVTYGGGVSFGGTAFKLSLSGKESVLYSFLAGYGASPDSEPTLGEKNALYGTTMYGGAYDTGAIFKITKKGDETVLYSFPGEGCCGNTANPNAMIWDEQGNLYGSTTMGGLAGGCFGAGCGSVFKLDPTGKVTVLYNFTGGKDGFYPSGAIARDSAGNLYGATAYGGDFSCFPDGCGVVFKVDTAGKETVLHTFTGTGGDGAQPWSGLVRDKEGALYGTTLDGGTGPACTSMENGCGTVFKISRTRKETILHSFTGTGADDPPIYATLVLDTEGNIYGTTPGGGSQNCNSGCGAVFMLDPTGKDTIFYEFTGGTNGFAPETGVILDAEGNIYGTTAGGGDLECDGGNGCGTIFKLTR